MTPRICRTLGLLCLFIGTALFLGAASSSHWAKIPPKDHARTMPEAVRFHYQPGQTDDLRPHARLFVLSQKMPWRVGAK